MQIVNHKFLDNNLMFLLNIFLFEDMSRGTGAAPIWSGRAVLGEIDPRGAFRANPPSEGGEIVAVWAGGQPRA